MISDKDFEVLKTGIRDAGAAVMSYYDDVIQAEFKQDDSPLTKADLHSNRIINTCLESLDSQFPIISEENEAWDVDTRCNFETAWIVDPLDGTKEFINKNGEFAICISLVHKNRAVVGLVYAPVIDELYYASIGKGAFMEKNNKISQLHASKVDLRSEGLKIGISRSHLNALNAEYIEQFDAPLLVKKGSILKITEIAKGTLDMYPRVDEKTSEWDIAAGQIILEEAGGAVLTIADAKPMTYNKLSLKNPAFIAHGKLL